MFAEMLLNHLSELEETGLQTFCIDNNGDRFTYEIDDLKNALEYAIKHIKAKNFANHAANEISKKAQETNIMYEELKLPKTPDFTVLSAVEYLTSVGFYVNLTLKE